MNSASMAARVSSSVTRSIRFVMSLPARGSAMARSIAGRRWSRRVAAAVIVVTVGACGSGGAPASVAPSFAALVWTGTGIPTAEGPISLPAGSYRFDWTVVPPGDQGCVFTTTLERIDGEELIAPVTLTSPPDAGTLKGSKIIALDGGRYAANVDPSGCARWDIAVHRV